MLILLGALAAGAVLVSEMPRAPAWLLALAALGHGFRLARRERRQPRIAFWFPGNDQAPTADGLPMHDAVVHWRGPLAFLRWRQQPDGPWRRLAWWPDTLPPASRRELRLAAGRGDAGRGRGGMAP